MTRNQIILAVVVVVLGLLSTSMLFTVSQGQQAMVLQLGAPVRVVQEPGLKIKIPLMQNVLFFERRLLDFDAEPTEVVLGDRTRIVMDSFARYRIVDPLLFFQTVRTEQGMRQRLASIVQSATRDVFGQVSFETLLTARRGELMRDITTRVVGASKPFGIEIVDVRIMRADLHPDNAPAIYARMQTERVREATQLRAEGAEIAQKTRGEADRERTVLLADANRKAAELRAQGDNEAAQIAAKAYGANPEFYAFWRSLEAYRKVLADSNSTIVLTPDSEFFRYFREMTPGSAPAKR
ncbi:MAG: protease modulator HflC [Alphaproteobacteria bacterium]|nr:protease modulator HflC [Alphaproteobacteria bacterium]